MIAVARWAAALVDPLGFSPHLSKFYRRWSPPKKRTISREQKVPRCQGSEVRLNRLVGDLRKATGTHTTAGCNRGVQNSLSERTCKHLQP